MKSGAVPYVVKLATPEEQAAYIAARRASGDGVYLRRLDDQTLTEAINDRKGRLGNVADYQCELALYQDEANRRAAK